VSFGADRLARLAAGILLSLRGSVCLYEGEELGLEEAELRFEDLADPYGIRFWPEYKGRDGCRTPMVWESNAENAGFTSGKPWLPIPEGHVARAANRQAGDAQSVLSAYRRLIAFRRAHPALRDGAIAFLDAPEDVLAFVREGGGETVVCLFNLGGAEARVGLPPARKVAPLPGHGYGGVLADGIVTLAPGDAFFGIAS